jgi:hypothetical protein
MSVVAHPFGAVADQGGKAVVVGWFAGADQVFHALAP